MVNNTKGGSLNQQPPTIEIRGLTKNYGNLLAVDHIDLDVYEGEIFGILGPNGAGKTTMINVLTTLLRPTEGTAKVLGFDVEKQAKEIRKKIGVVFQNTILEDDLTARETIDIHARLYGVPKEDREKRIRELLDLFHLEDRQNDLVGTFSGGMKRRLEVANGILHDPKVLFLDEPTVGLDPQSREVVWRYIEKINREKRMTILLTTHYMDEADRLCDRVGLIDNGRIVALGTPKSLKADVSPEEVIEVELESPNEEAIRKIKRIGFVKEVISEGNTFRITVERGGKIFSQIIEQLNNEKIEIRSIFLRETTLNDVFLHYTGREIRD